MNDIATAIETIANAMAYDHQQSPEVIAAGGSCATDACNFDRSTLVRSLSESDIEINDENLDALRHALANALG